MLHNDFIDNDKYQEKIQQKEMIELELNKKNLLQIDLATLCKDN